MVRDLPTMRLIRSFYTRYRFELYFQCHQFECGMSTSREEAIEEMKECRSMTDPLCRSTVIPEDRTSLFHDRIKPIRHHKSPGKLLDDLKPYLYVF
ncbi:hypothetical protein IGI04_007217 [Brassica rapa subsp. trilocularis]|uniref:Uncharacterized protein n=1 Tax=Brassica rapa subsp. trilocularis TaxID=1813537 RepID=A0ABQ7NJ34_BRACM|nr:hypothetical protein IGI04_007217 [Brassica rapa subsp. trilocularis]